MSSANLVPTGIDYGRLVEGNFLVAGDEHDIKETCVCVCVSKGCSIEKTGVGGHIQYPHMALLGSSRFELAPSI